MKTYLIGKSADAAIPSIPELAYESASDHLSSINTPTNELSSKIYIDKLEEEKQIDLGKKDIHLVNEGNKYEDVTRFGPRTRRIESDTESVDSIMAQQKEPRCAHVFADCDLKRTEDRSSNEVYIAEPLWGSASFLLKVTVRKRKTEEPPKADYGMEQEGQRFQGAIIIKKEHKFDSDSEKSSVILEDIEPPPANYEMEKAGQLLEGQSRIRRTKKYDSESSAGTEEEVRQLGGITHVTLIKKESAGTFDVTIECPRIGEPLSLSIKEKPKQKFESLEFMKTIEKQGGKSAERVEQIIQDKNVVKGTMDVIAQGSEETTLIVAIQKEKKYRDDEDEETSAKKSFKTQRVESAKSKIRECTEENAMVMYSLECETPKKAEWSKPVLGQFIFILYLFFISCVHHTFSHFPGTLSTPCDFNFVFTVLHAFRFYFALVSPDVGYLPVRSIDQRVHYPMNGLNTSPSTRPTGSLPSSLTIYSIYGLVPD